MKLVVDTNIWVAALISQGFRTRLEQLFLNSDFEFLGSEELLQELWEVLVRPKFRRFCTIEEVDIFVQAVKARMEMVVITSQIRACRDEKDNYLLAICVDGNAKVLITGDQDLTTLSPWNEVEIITLTDFEERYVSF